MTGLSLKVLLVHAGMLFVLAQVYRNCRLMINLVNSLDPDQARQNVGPDLDPNCLALRWYS